MSSAPSLPDPADRATQRDEDAQYYRQVLHELIEIGTDLARSLQRQAAAQPAPAPDPTIAFDRIARTIRRTIALARKLSDPTPPRAAERAATQAAERRRLARKQVIRAVEDCIQRNADGPDAEALQAEFYERLETIDCEDDLANLPIAELIALIRRDLGLAALPGTHPWKRRKPADLGELYARATQPRTAQPSLAQLPTVLPRPFAAPPPRAPTSTGPPRR